MSMANSLEARVPYLDREMIELAFRIPQEHKLQGRRTKLLLKELARRHLPPNCINRPKQGFSIPIKNWLCDEMKPLLEDSLDRSRVRQDGIFDPAETERLKSEHLAGKANHSHALWSLIVFQNWQSMWAEGNARSLLKKSWPGAVLLARFDHRGFPAIGHEGFVVRGPLSRLVLYQRKEILTHRDGISELSDGVTRPFRCPASLRASFLAESSEKPSL